MICILNWSHFYQSWDERLDSDLYSQLVSCLSVISWSLVAIKLTVQYLLILFLCIARVQELTEQTHHLAESAKSFDETIQFKDNKIEVLCKNSSFSSTWSHSDKDTVRTPVSVVYSHSDGDAYQHWSFSSRVNAPKFDTFQISTLSVVIFMRLRDRLTLPDNVFAVNTEIGSPTLHVKKSGKLWTVLKVLNWKLLFAWILFALTGYNKADYRIVLASPGLMGVAPNYQSIW